MAPKLLILLSFMVVALAFATQSAAALPPPTFTHGVASGDVTPISAVLWTRVAQSSSLTVEVSRNANFHSGVLRRSVEARAQDDFTVKAFVAPLLPNSTYYYRFKRGSALSETGTFRTAAWPFQAKDVRFAYSGDSDGAKVGGIPFFNNFEVLNAARAEDPDFFVYLGDTIYSDSSLRPAGPATTLDEYRSSYKDNREYQALRDLMKATSVYAMWDDHEVQNDYNGETVDDARYANGTEAFLEYMPVLEIKLPDPACEHNPLFRVFRWGKDVEVIIPDVRSCRSADAAPACVNEVAPGVFIPDLAPTLPSFLRPAFGLPATPPAGCLDTIFDPDRTMLGNVQKRVLKAVLEHSNAKFKFIMNGVPIQQYYALPYDRWEGYGAERNELLNFIRDKSIANVVFLTTDNHANFSNEVFIDRFADPGTIAYDFVAGPIATFTLQQEIEFFAASIGAPPAALVASFNGALDLVGVDCRDLSQPAYGLVEIDASAGTATVTFKDDTGATILDQSTSAPCSKTLGP
ncbi:MAG: alkaline phosphatase D family protein [Dehalococcoidia bacterium]